MTLGDFLNSVKRYWKALLVGIMVCTLLGLGYGILQRGIYKVTASVTSNVDITAVKGQAESAARKQENVTIGVTADTTSKTVTISGESDTARDVVVGVNKVVDSTVAAAAKMASNAATSKAYARQASYSKRNPLIFAIAGFVGGTLLVLLVMVIKTNLHAPVNSSSELEELTGIPILGTLPTEDKGALLAANVTFAGGDSMDTLCVMPVSTVDTSDTAELLAGALSQMDTASKPHVLACEGTVSSVDAVYEAKRSSATVLAIAEWKDSLKDVERTLHELTIAKANVIGIVYVTAV